MFVCLHSNTGYHAVVTELASTFHSEHTTEYVAQVPKQHLDKMTTPSREPPSQSPSSSIPPSSPATSRSSLSESRSPGGHPSSLRLANMPNASAQHRQSFSELRGLPPSPRSQRQPSVSQIAVQELIDNPPRNAPDPKFAGRDWRTVEVQELTSPSDLKFVDVDTGVEDATKVGHGVVDYRFTS